MALQEEIALEQNRAKIGKIFKVIIDREETDYYIGRTEFDSPEVDPEVFVDNAVKLITGDFYGVEIIDALPFDLFGKIAK